LESVWAEEEAAGGALEENLEVERFGEGGKGGCDLE
jgi:hypothetical protein